MQFKLGHFFYTTRLLLAMLIFGIFEMSFRAVSKRSEAISAGQCANDVNASTNAVAHNVLILPFLWFWFSGRRAIRGPASNVLTASGFLSTHFYRGVVATTKLDRHKAQNLQSNPTKQKPIKRNARSSRQLIEKPFFINSAANEAATAVLSNGDFVVVWSTSLGNLYGQRYQMSGHRVRSEFQLKSFGGAFNSLAVESLVGGDFVVVFPDARSPSGQLGKAQIYGQRYSGINDTTLSDIIPISAAQSSAYNMGEPSVTALPNGELLVVWSAFDTGTHIWFGERVSTQGHPLSYGFDFTGPGLRGLRSPMNIPTLACIGVLSDGNFVVAWQEQVKRQAFMQVSMIYAQKFFMNGSLWDSPIPIREKSDRENIDRLLIQGLSNKAFIVVWSTVSRNNGYATATGGASKIEGSVIFVNGSKHKINFNFSVDSQQSLPALTQLSENGFAIAWLEKPINENYCYNPQMLQLSKGRRRRRRNVPPMSNITENCVANVSVQAFGLDGEKRAKPHLMVSEVINGSTPGGPQVNSLSRLPNGNLILTWLSQKILFGKITISPDSSNDTESKQTSTQAPMALQLAEESNNKGCKASLVSGLFAFALGASGGILATYYLLSQRMARLSDKGSLEEAPSSENKEGFIVIDELTHRTHRKI